MKARRGGGGVNQKLEQLKQALAVEMLCKVSNDVALLQ
jgi:hypothetical protein